MIRWRRMKELALIAIACGMLSFEAVVLWGALPVVRRAIHPATRRHVRVIAVTSDGSIRGTTVCRSLRPKPDLGLGVSAALRQALL